MRRLLGLQGAGKVDAEPDDVGRVLGGIDAGQHVFPFWSHPTVHRIGHHVGEATTQRADLAASRHGPILKRNLGAIIAGAYSR